jgi:thiol-disulfide isomerase/thioredoxin
VVVLDFWFSTCGPCCRAMPTLADLRRKYREDQVLIVGMNNDPTVAAAQRYLRQNSHNWMQIHLPSQRPDPRQTYGVNLFPTFVVIDQVGNMQYKGNSVAQAVQKVSELVSSPSISTLASASGSPSAYLR